MPSSVLTYLVLCSWMQCLPVQRTLLLSSGLCSRHCNVMGNHRHTFLRSRSGQKTNSGAFFSFLSRVLYMLPEDLEQIIRRSSSWDGTSSHSRKAALSISAAVDFSFFSFLRMQRKSCSNQGYHSRNTQQCSDFSLRLTSRRAVDILHLA